MFSQIPIIPLLYNTNTNRTMNLYRVSLALLFLCFLITITVGSNNPTHFTGDVSINCGSTGTSAARNGREWLGDVQPRFSSLLQISGLSTTSTVIHKLTSADPVPHKTARVSRSHFSYAFQVSPGQKIIRFHFNPSPYKGFRGFKDLFTVEAGPFTLLSNFSASLTAYTLGVNTFTKEFCLNIQENQQFNIVFSPESSQTQDTFAFINGIEIVSVPASLSYFQGGHIGLQVVGQKSLVYVDNSTALEIIHRLNIKQDLVSSADDSDDMLGMWVPAPTQEVNNITWKISVDVGFRYLVRIHYSKIGFKTSEIGGLSFEVLINEMVANTNTDIVKERDDSSIPWYGDYMVMMNGRKQEGKHNILICLQSNEKFMDGHVPLKGFEIFKLSNPDSSLASPNPLPPAQDSPSQTIQTLLSILGCRNATPTLAITIISLVNIIVHKLREIWEYSSTEEENKPSARAERRYRHFILVNIIVRKLREIWEDSSSEEKNKPSARAERLCRHFSLVEIQLATKNFSDGLLIGKGGFGKVYKGLIDKGQKTVAVKRLKSNSRQGAHEFLTEIETLSELRHVNLVSLIGYCSMRREMILVYEYMARGTLADHLYKLARDNSGCCLTWKQCLNICIGAARGLDYLHTSHGVIHRDVKASNILLDENFTAKVSDFGLAKREDRSKLQSHVSTNVKGTFGYFDPYYFSTHKLTRKSDTYAFGVVLLEVLCGRKAVDSGVLEDELILSNWARDKISKGEVDQIVASSLREDISPNSLKTFVGVAERCLLDEPKSRPTMSQVLLQLELALEQQESKQLLVLNEISRVFDEIEQSVNKEPPTMESTDVQNLTTPLKEQTNSKVVTAELPAGRKHGRKATIHKASRLWPWDAFWNIVKPSKKNKLLLSEEEIYEDSKFDRDKIADATIHFSSSNIVGQRGFRSVYKAVLPSGQVVAIIKLSPYPFDGCPEFTSEILSRANLQHRNIIKLLGYRIHGEEKLLVYEFIENESLDAFIAKRRCLQWPVRLKIMMGIARGVVYLHQNSGVRIFHRVLTPSNILMDIKMNPKISDFAIARTSLKHQSKLKTNQIVGTFSYLAPECVEGGSFSTKSDVYSFGIIVLEIVSGRRLYTNDADPVFLLLDYAWKLWSEGKALDLVDDSLAGAFPADEAVRCIQVGLLCTQWQPNLRPEMPSVLKMLEGDELPGEPQNPGPPAPREFSACSSEYNDGVDRIANFELDDTEERS